MKKDFDFNIKESWIKKFGYAFKGLFVALKEEKTLIIDFVIAAIVITIAGILHKHLKAVHWIILVMVICFVISMELINTAVENLVDVVSFTYSYNAKKIKDISAAATLVLSIMSVIVAVLIIISCAFEKSAI